MDISVIVLAAGAGTRMRSARPKLLQALAGQPILHHVLHTVCRLSSQPPIVVKGGGLHGKEIEKSCINHGFSAKWAEQKKPLGTGDAVRVALLEQEKKSTKVLIVNGDVPLIQLTTLEALIAKTQKNAIGLLTFSPPDTTGLGRVVRGLDGQVMRIIEERDADSLQKTIEEVNAGIYLFPVDFLQQTISKLTTDNAQGEFYLTDIIELAVNQGITIDSLKIDNHWEAQGINTMVELSQIERYWQQTKAKQLMSQGVKIADPHRLDIRGDVTVGQDVQIDINVILEGKVTIEDGVTIGPQVFIKDSHIAEDAVIKANSFIENTHVGAQCCIGPFARLRVGTQLAQGARIGNFVETKKAIIGRDSKVNHLSYIGDATIGVGVNIGAGTITCNYDGLKKSKTTIADYAFIGSGSLLRAPVAVGRGATVGAGTTLIQDAPAEKLTITEKKQLTHTTWKRSEKTKIKKAVEEEQ